ncbi:MULTISPECIES: cysteine synthase family protein [Streptomyces]|uniref:Cysteine synthase family protein n=1 Tax=Streptomyces koelreuteriae TaxID=2838015 RepID=A0ABX8FM18_9ACTN|nr:MULTISPECIES: cysteine synthase family protein [Streptomyces]QWB22169.1 cysteine synthase family protein [Streptomyces koelreuteriae]UUA05111.1 cysteine synthase family protein [Streptomyces koelreuteriae]UUA12735.1 cysteine synthase family protein [Streptomyces sp. CRCS-T-1]
MIHPHIADALKVPDLVRLTDGLVLLRFESMKIYSALAAVRRLLDRGTVRPGQTLIDSSSGIYAYALALACHRHGMRCHIVASTTVDATTRAQLEILGATVEQVEPSRNLKLDQELRVRRVREILAERPDCHWMRQYHDDIHCLGYHEVADRIAQAFPDTPLTVVGGVGSGASTGGLVERLRETERSVRLVGVQPFGSVTFGSQDHHDPEAIIAGIGSSIVFDNVRHHLYDTVHWMDFTHAMSGAVSLLREHAVFAGLSTGAGYLAATYEARRHPDRLHLVIGADTGHRYVERVFARHPEALDPASLKPFEVRDPEEMSMPWSRMAWRRTACPARWKERAA